MHIEAEAIVCAVRAHGEHGAIVRALTPEDGLIAGYVRGGRSRRLRPVLIPGNRIRGDWRARSEDQLPALVAELVESRAGLLGEPLAAMAIDWVTALTTATLPEGQPYPRLYSALEAVLAAVAAAPSARGWTSALARYELLLLAELGFGLDLTECVATGAHADLAYVSPKSGGAVSRAAGEPYRERLLPLPEFLIAGGAGEWPDLMAGLALTGHFLARDLLHGKAADTLAARERLVTSLRRISG
ncbi:DNA repair protein RecO [Sphingomonas sp. AP4-R1]|uniref:DNA repair protein RecO n=1 Tax=Sphingomonas sp. AP4-R1 TaxID=2735134 RepID=UPI0014932E80|nr:DNA repair protein RecO [Sphingomonas sp. AP4-R1]QJU58614.1 DNA repair protein RecO [Sphingomonas sp. AP4-R1]